MGKKDNKDLLKFLKTFPSEIQERVLVLPQSIYFKLCHSEGAQRPPVCQSLGARQEESNE